MKRGTIGFLVAAFASTLAQTAAAQSTPTVIPTETLKAQTATKGTTDVAKGGFAAGGIPADDDPRQATEASVAAGGLFASGNARTVALTSMGKLRLRRDAPVHGSGRRELRARRQEGRERR